MTSPFDFVLQWSGLALCASLLGFLIYTRSCPKLRTLQWFLAYSLAVTALLTYMLHYSNMVEYAHVYWITQSISYLLEAAICVQLAKIVVVNNWHIMAIFTPFVFAGTAFSVIAYGIPLSLSDVIRPVYICTMWCGFVLLIVWILEGRFEGELEQPYSGIALVFTCYLAIRFAIAYTHSYYQSSHWAIIGRLNPINEVLLLVGWASVVVHDRLKKPPNQSTMA